MKYGIEKVEEKNITIRYIKTKFGTFAINDLMDTLSQLEGTDNWGQRLIIHNSNMQEYLIDMGIFETNTNGSGAVKDEELRDKLYDYLYEL